MKWMIMDSEVFPEWFCFCIKEKGTENRIAITSDDMDDLSKLSSIMGDRDNVIVGYNCKGYDLSIANLVLALWRGREDPASICRKAFSLSSAIIGGTAPKGYPFGLCSFTDLQDDISEWLSLKEYESNKGLEIKETDIPFGKTDLQPWEKQMIVAYCFKDVDATDAMLCDRWNYIQTKLRLAERFCIDPRVALKRTDPSLCCDILVRDKNFDKSFLSQPISYVLPEKVSSYVKAHLPPWLVDIFINYDSFGSADKTIEQFGNIVSIGYGGLHSVNKKNAGKDTDVLFVDQKAGWVNVTIDVQSYYPHLIVNFDYQSRAVSDRSLFPVVLEQRMEAKSILLGDSSNIRAKQDANDLKLILNATGGAMKQQFLSLYDPEQNVRMCFTGQLLLLALCKELYDSCGVVIIQTNTDGIAMRIPYGSRRDVYQRIKRWETMTDMSFDIETFDRLWQSNVNNYVMTHKGGRPKIVGAWMDDSIDPFHNIHFPIIKKAMREYLISGVSIASTVDAETQPMMFLCTAKRGATFDRTIMRTSRMDVELGKVNRIYASMGKGSGTLYKTKGQSRQLMPDCPQNAKIYNDAVTVLPSDLDRVWYIKEATNAVSKLTRIDL